MILVIYFLIKAALAGRLSCDDILTSIKEIPFNETQLIETPFIIEYMQKVNFKKLPTDKANLIWYSIVKHFKGVSKVPEEVLLNLRWLTPAVKPDDYPYLTLGDIDIIENFGSNYNLSEEQLLAIADRVKEGLASKQPEDYTSYDLKALRNILCAFNRSEIERIHPSEYKEAAEVIGKLKCRPYVMVGFATLAVKKEAYGPATSWNEDIISDVGRIVKYLPTKVINKLSISNSCDKLLQSLVEKMTTASVLLTVGTTWSSNGDKCEKDDRVGRAPWNPSAVAARELRETPAAREQALRIMRDWIQQNNDIKNVREDDTFLLKFLRQKKYSIPMAQQTLLKYLSLRKYYPESFSNLDYEDPSIADILNNGYIVVSPVRDSMGRRVIVYNMNKFNANKYTCWDMCRVHIIVYETLLEDSTDQILGITHVGEGTGVTAAHVTAWNPTDFARIIKWGEQSVPMRHKEFHLVNIPSAIKYIIDFALSKVTPKMAQRLHIHANMKQLHKSVDVSCLPIEYGGTLQLQEMISHTRQLLSEQKKKLLALDVMQILSTRGITSSRNRPIIIDGTVSIQGSFRKLDID